MKIIKEDNEGKSLLKAFSGRTKTYFVYKENGQNVIYRDGKRIDYVLEKDTLEDNYYFDMKALNAAINEVT